MKTYENHTKTFQKTHMNTNENHKKTYENHQKTYENLKKTHENHKKHENHKNEIPNEQTRASSCARACTCARRLHFNSINDKITNITLGVSSNATLAIKAERTKTHAQHALAAEVFTNTEIALPRKAATAKTCARRREWERQF